MNNKEHDLTDSISYVCRNCLLGNEETPGRSGRNEYIDLMPDITP